MAEEVMIGASLVLVTVMVKVSVAVALLPSVAVTFTSMAPTSPLAGVPLKVRVLASKLIQLGRALSLDRVAV